MELVLNILLTRQLSGTKNSLLGFASLHILASYYQPLIGALYAQGGLVKYLILLLSIYSGFSFSECTTEQNSAPININTTVNISGVKAGGNHGYMDVITIEIPKAILGVPFKSIEMTEGEVAEYWIPVQTIVQGDNVVASFSGHKSRILNLEFAVSFHNKSCILSAYTSVASAYNKSLKQDK